MDLYVNDLFVCRKFVPITRNGDCNCRVARLLPFFQYDEEGNLSELASIVAHGNITTLNDFIKETGNVRLSDRHGNTPLHLSVIFKKIDIFNYLLSLDGANVDAINRYGQTCLHLAAIDELEDFALTLLRRGADVNFSDESCCTPLHAAATRAAPAMCRLLLKHDADMHSQNLLGKSALYHACQYGSMETVCMLLYYGANAAATDRFGVLPLTAAMQHSPHRHDLHEILFNYTFERRKVSVHLKTLTTAMKIASPLLPDLLKKVDGVKYGRNDLIELSRTAVLVETASFANFMPKHVDVVAEMLDFSNELYHQFAICDDADSLAVKLMDLLTLLFDFRRSFNFLKASRCFGDLVPVLVRLHKDKRLSLGRLTETVCFLYSYGLTCEFEHVVAVYEVCGHCDLLKMMLQMDFDVPQKKPESLMAHLICDVSMTVDEVLDLADVPEARLASVLKFFASRRLRDFFATNTELYDRVRCLPEVPSLVELARNAARKHIVDRFEVKRTREFYELIKRMPISEVYKKILTYEKELYDFERVRECLFYF